jgi:hypothetical protein
MKTLKESLLADIESSMSMGDNFVKGLDDEITNIQKNITKAKNWINEAKFSSQIETRLYTEFDAKNILEFLGIPSRVNKIVAVVEYLGRWPYGGNGKKYYNIYIGADYAETKPIYRKNDIAVDNKMTHIKFIKQHVLPCFDSPETLKNLYEKSQRIITR